MKIVIPKKNFELDELFLYFVLSDLFILVFLQAGQFLVENLIILMATVLTVKMAVTNKSILTKLITVGIVFAYLIAVTVYRGSDKFLIENLKLLYSPMILLIYLIALQNEKPYIIKKVISNHYVFFNVYYFINLIFMIYQLKQGVFFDNVTGFIGLYGTHRLTMFVCFLIVLNLNTIKKLDGIKKRNLILYTVFVFGSSLVISSMNDNNALYILMPLIMVMYLFLTQKISFKTILKIAIIIAVMFIALQQLVKIDEIAEFFDKRLFAKIDEMLVIFSTGKTEEERFVYIDYALSHMHGRDIGMGIGRYKLVGDATISSISKALRNWGMSNMASFIAAGGVIFMVSYLFVYAYVASVPNKNKKIFPVFLIIFLILFYYGQTATSIPMMIAVWLVLNALGTENNDDESKSELNENRHFNISIRY